MKKLIPLFGVMVIITTGCGYNYNEENYKENNNSEKIYANNQKISNYISIKYRGTAVDVSEFESFNTSKSSFIEKAYYDKNNQYLILNLNGINYHRCEVPEYIWNEFKKADSLGKYYNQYIKGEYDCRLGYIPQYN